MRSTASLSATTDSFPGATAWEWTPAGSLSDPTIANPVASPEDRDADLTVVLGMRAPALGEPLIVSGWLLRPDGPAVEGATVEIWQTDHQGVYLHPGDPDFERRDRGFQGYGESVTDADGRWSFRTILPEVYGSRPRHIHAKVRLDGSELLTTQIYFSGGDIPPEGAVDLTGTELDALIVEAVRRTREDGEALLTAEHLLIVP